MDQFQLGVKALILKDDTLLLIGRSPSAPSFPEYWDLPGGLVDHNELPDKAILREIKEETNLEIENLVLVSDTVFQRNNVPTVALFYLADYKEGNIDLSDEHDKYAWIKLSEVKREKLQPWIHEHLLELLKKYNTPQ